MQSRAAQQRIGDRTMVALVILGALVVGLLVAVVMMSTGSGRADNAAAPAVDAPRSINLPSDRVALSVGGASQAATTSSINLPADRVALSLGESATSTKKSISLPSVRMQLTAPDAPADEPARYDVPVDRLRVFFGE